MKKNIFSIGYVVALFSLVITACKLNKSDGVVVLPAPEKKSLLLVATSQKRWTGIAVSKSSRVFVNYPNWAPDHTISVAELKDTTTVAAFPDANWNVADSTDPANHFICVQSVFVDRNDDLWVLDPANPQRNGEYVGVIQGGAKLIRFDLTTGQVKQKIIFAPPAITGNSYLNDVRIDEDKKIAYITDSNEGAIVVVELATGKARRLLANDPSTKSENIPIVVEGITWRKPNGQLPVVHSDGIALSPDRSYLYWRATTAKSLYRIATAALNDPSQTDSSLGKQVQLVNILPPSDGIIFGNDGKLYLTSVEQDAVLKTENGLDAQIIAQSSELKWPDSFSNSPDGYLYVTVSEVHLQTPVEPYKIFKFKLE